MSNGMSAQSEWNKIVALKGDDDREKHAMGISYNNIVEHKLAEKEGFKSAREFLTEMLKQAALAAPIDGLKVRELSRATLANYGTLAKLFDSDAFVEYGYSNLHLFLRYRKLAGIDPAKPLSQVTVSVPGPDGSTLAKPLRECTARDLRSAIGAFRSPSDPLTDEDQATLELLNLAIDVVVGAERRCDVSARISSDEVLVSLKDVPLVQLEEALWAMLEVVQKR